MILKCLNIEQKEINSILKKYCNKFDIRNTTLDDSGVIEKTIEVKIKEKDVDNLLKDLKEIKGVTKVMIFSHTGELSE